MMQEKKLTEKKSHFYNGSPIESVTYDSIGIYTHSGTVNYAAGEYLVNNKGEVTDKRGGSWFISATAQVTATILVF